MLRSCALVPLLALLACAPSAKSPASPPADTIVFVCEHGAAKSVLAAATFNELAAERGLSVRAIARGADPQPEPSKPTLAGLRRDGLAAPADRPRPLTGGDVRSSAQIVVFDCATPAMKPLASLGTCWDDVPAIGDGYDQARDRIRAHVTTLLPPP